MKSLKFASIFTICIVLLFYVGNAINIHDFNVYYWEKKEIDAIIVIGIITFIASLLLAPLMTKQTK